MIRKRCLSEVSFSRHEDEAYRLSSGFVTREPGTYASTQHGAQVETEWTAGGREEVE